MMWNIALYEQFCGTQIDNVALHLHWESVWLIVKAILNEQVPAFGNIVYTVLHTHINSFAFAFAYQKCIKSFFKFQMFNVQQM